MRILPQCLLSLPIPTPQLQSINSAAKLLKHTPGAHKLSLKRDLRATAESILFWEL